MAGRDPDSTRAVTARGARPVVVASRRIRARARAPARRPGLNGAPPSRTWLVVHPNGMTIVSPANCCLAGDLWAMTSLVMKAVVERVVLGDLGDSCVARRTPVVLRHWDRCSGVPQS